VESFEIFKDKQLVVNPKEHKLSKYLHYTFGVEFETSQGYIPQDICFRDGLIPLRDGSITGLEYSTVVLNGNEGLCLLEQQVESLKEYTYFNKECSLHIHMGGYPLDPLKIFRLYNTCKKLEPYIEHIVPNLTFNSAEYKLNGKDYCTKLANYKNFEELYTGLVGRKFMDSFTQPHPLDIRREAKWHIDTRYTWVNFINALCYNVNKTIEFRFLRPTYNFKKIVLWLYIFNAILKFSEEMTTVREVNKPDLLKYIVKKVYPEDISNEILGGIQRLEILKENQTRNADFIGKDTEMETLLFPDSLEF
jgi:hypothetical protein